MSDSGGFQTLLFQKQGAVAHISLNRPQVVNAYNIQMRDDFSEALSAVELDPDVRSLLITGEGRGFCADADLTEFGSAP
ncbi:MAG: enoyl-CoA hydratase/isomerase family protein, partial [Chloroflexi bacterium]|nr:enoyl-CoA hydratase/isomerase family protein [Chloroflexota bacterium]